MAIRGRFFHGSQMLLLPALYIFCMNSRYAARLRTSNQDAQPGAWDELQRIVDADQGRTGPRPRSSSAVTRFLPGSDLCWWKRTRKAISPVWHAMPGWCEPSAVNFWPMTSIGAGNPARCFRDFYYRTRKSWSRPPDG